jgi:hypothetical protein
MGPDPSGHREYIGEREQERDREAELERAREEHDAMEDEPKKPSFWQRLFGKKS